MLLKIAKSFRFTGESEIRMKVLIRYYKKQGILVNQSTLLERLIDVAYDREKIINRVYLEELRKEVKHDLWA